MSDKILSNPIIKEYDEELFVMQKMMEKLMKDMEATRKAREQEIILLRQQQGNTNQSLNRMMMYDVKP